MRALVAVLLVMLSSVIVLVAAACIAVPTIAGGSSLPVAIVALAPTTPSVAVGESVQLNATLQDAEGTILTDRIVLWFTSNPSVAMVSSTGLVTGIANGTATIAATSEGQTGSTAVTVTSEPTTPVASVEISPASASLLVGATVQLTATTLDGSGAPLTGRSVTWTSGNTAVASVSSSGLVTGVSAGTAIITATSEGVQGSATVAVTAPTAPGTVTDLAVTKVEANAVVLSFTEVDDGTGSPASYDVRFAPSPITWGSATQVYQGTCSLPVAGTAIGATRSCSVQGLATATTYDFQLVAFRGTLDLNAVFGKLSNIAKATTGSSTAPVASVSVSPSSVTIGVGGSQQLTATTKDANGNTLSGRTVTWASANSAVASVSSSGLVTGIATGTTTITATSEGQTGSATVTVDLVSLSQWPNQPSGLTLLTDNPWTVLSNPGWRTYDDGVPNISIVLDASAPFSASAVYEHLYPAGMVGGTAGGKSWFNFSRDELFIGLYFKYNEGWQQHSGGISKMFYVFQTSPSDVNNRQSNFMALRGSAGGPYRLEISNEAGGGAWWTQNIANVEVPVGVWHRLELYYKKASSTGASDGIVRWWVNGTLAADHRNANLRGDPFTELHVAPVWGGGSDNTKQQTDYLRFDHIFMSGR